MSGFAKLSGFEELRRELTNAPQELRERAMAIVRDETEGAAIEIVQRLPAKTGTLRRRVRTFYPASGALVGIVRSSAPHSHLYEFGTQERRTSRGANRGRMPEKDITVPVAVRRRERMTRRLIEMVRGFGLFQVTER